MTSVLIIVIMRRSLSSFALSRASQARVDSTSACISLLIQVKLQRLWLLVVTDLQLDIYIRWSFFCPAQSVLFERFEPVINTLAHTTMKLPCQHHCCAENGPVYKKWPAQQWPFALIGLQGVVCDSCAPFVKFTILLYALSKLCHSTHHA